MGLNAGGSFNLRGIFKLSATVDLGSYTFTADKNGMTDKDTLGLELGIEVADSKGKGGAIGIRISKESTPLDPSKILSDSTELVQHIGNAWTGDGEIKIEPMGGVKKGKHTEVSTTDKDFVLEFGGGAGFSLKGWLNLTEVKDLFQSLGKIVPEIISGQE